MKIEYNPIIKLLILYLQNIPNLTSKEREIIINVAEKLSSVGIILRPKSLAEVEGLAKSLEKLSKSTIVYIPEEE